MITRYPAARIRERVAGELVEVREIRPRDLVCGEQLVLEGRAATVAELHDEGRARPGVRRYRYRLDGEESWRSVAPQAWLKVIA